MGRRRWNKKNPDKLKSQQPRAEEAADPAVRLLALQPSSSTVAVAIGTRVTIVDTKTGQQVALALPQLPSASEPKLPHTGSLRVLTFSADGRHLLTGGDDKLARLWRADAVHTAAAAGSSAAAAAGASAAVTEASGGASAGPGDAAWGCVATWRTPKKMSAGGFSLDSAYALFADKFGDVLLGPVPPAAAAAAAGGEAASSGAALADPEPRVPSTLLGHFCSIVTGLAPSPCGRYLATSDKDYKVRVSELPADLRQGSYEIHCYCLGHEEFVSCIAFAVHRTAQGDGGGAAAADALIVSGSGDGTVRLWDHLTGAQVAVYAASKPTAAAAAAAAPPQEGGATGGGGAAESSGVDEGGAAGASGAGEDGDDEGDDDGEGPGVGGGDADGGAAGDGDGDGDGNGGVEPQRRRKAPPCAPVLSLAVSDDGCNVAVVVEGEDDLQLLTIDWAARTLSLRQRLRWPDVRYPCQAAFGSGGQLWVVGGVPLPSARSVHIGVARPGPDGLYEPCTEEVLSPAVRAVLEARVKDEEAKMAEGGELYAYSKRLCKPEYAEGEMEQRKQRRTDLKETARLAALRQRQDAAKQGTQQGQAQG